MRCCAISLGWALALFAALQGASGAEPFTTTICTDYLNKMCAEVNNAAVRLYISDQAGPYYSMTVRVKKVWLSNPILPTILHWRDCVGFGTNHTESYNDTMVICDAVGFSGTSMTFTIRVFTQNSTVRSGTETFVAAPGSMELLYNLQFSQACEIQDDYPCDTELVNVRARCTAGPAVAVSALRPRSLVRHCRQHWNLRGTCRRA